MTEVKMKRFIVAAMMGLTILVCSGEIWGETFSLGVNINYYAHSDSLYKDIYGGGSVMPGASIGVLLIKRLELRGETFYYHDNGSLTLSGEEISFAVIPIVVGLRFQIMQSNSFAPYVGVGIDYYIYEESYPERFEDYSGSATGFHIECGTYFRLSRRFALDLNFRYIKVDSEPFNEKIGLGGFKTGLGIKFRF